MAYHFGKDKFRPVAEVILTMVPAEQEILYNAAMRIIRKLDYTDLITLMTLVQSDMIIQGQLLSTVMNHLNTRLHLEVKE